jgi:hypothetical protein
MKPGTDSPQRGLQLRRSQERVGSALTDHASRWESRPAIVVGKGRSD